jgi:hypothetical protein
MKPFLLHRLFPAFAAFLLTITLAAPAARSAGADGNAPAAEQSKAAPKAASKTNAKAAPKAGSRDASAKSANVVGKSADEILHQKLEKFGHDAIEKMNKHALPSHGKKEVVRNKDGSYTARYVSIDPASLRVSFKNAEPAGTVSHIGYLHYTEREYFCTASTADAAKNGPFEPKISRGQTELIKYVRGNWSY